MEWEVARNIIKEIVLGFLIIVISVLLSIGATYWLIATPTIEGPEWNSKIENWMLRKI